MNVLLVIVFAAWIVVQALGCRDYVRFKAENKKLVAANKWMNGRLDEIDV